MKRSKALKRAMKFAAWRLRQQTSIGPPTYAEAITRATLNMAAESTWRSLVRDKGMTVRIRKPAQYGDWAGQQERAGV